MDFPLAKPSFCKFTTRGVARDAPTTLLAPKVERKNLFGEIFY
jgi:hypothetical protein